MSRQRIDKYMVEMGLASSRTKAQDLIRAKRVFLERAGEQRPVQDPSSLLPTEEGWTVQVLESELDRYVSRGGLKLEGALQKLGLNPLGLRVLDIGISTGGFTDCLLQAGAKSVLGVDVGHGQLAPKLQIDSRLALVEGVNARELHSHSEIAPHLLLPFDLVVCDVSFISLKLIVPEIALALGPGGMALCLVKPQFEVGPENIAKGGIVRDPSLYAAVEEQIRRTFLEQGFTVRAYFESSVLGKDGNREFFVFAEKKADSRANHS